MLNSIASRIINENAEKRSHYSVSGLLLMLLFVFSNSLSVFSQSSEKIQELEKKLQNTTDNNSRIGILNSLGELYLRAEPSKARKYSLIAFDLSVKTNNLKGKINSCNTIGNSYYLEGNYNGALEYYLKALKIVEETGDKKGIANSLMGIGNIYSAQGNNKLALEYQQRSLKIRQELNDKEGIAACYNNIGIIYLDQKEYDKALDYELRSLKIKEEIGDKKGMSSNLGNIGTICYLQGNYPLAMDHQQMAFNIRKALNNKKGMAMSYVDIGNINEKLGKYDEAVKSQLEAVKIAKEVGYKVALQSAYLGLSSVSEQQNNTKSALEYYKLYTDIKDSIFNKENSSKLIEMQAKFDSENKEKEIVLLTKGREIQSLEAKQRELELTRHKMEASQRKKEIELTENELQSERLKNESKNKEILIQETELRSQRLMRNVVTGGLLVVGLIAFMLIIGFRQKHNANKALEIKNKEIEDAYEIIEKNHDQISEKNKNITDSINYAKRIQQAMLPSEEEIRQTLDEYFIIYKPKDIVSGDFYFYAERNEKTIFAVSDCTGHGVPGAFMSMIGNDILNQIIIENGITRPSDILNQLNKGVKRALKQESVNSEAKDGMDIAICTIDMKTKKVEYAGAMRPLYYGADAFYNIPGDKASIGGSTREDYQFTNNELNLKAGDSLYIFTDGYVDQFGGPKGKKFMAKNLKLLLADINKKSMKEQQTILDQTIVNWAKEKEQVDDILVMGMRL